MTTQYQKKICSGYEPVPGYVLEEILGRGGFGEVWRSSAPGGLKKAVKFVFGAQGESRASRELRSLERIKTVNHPFLLTLERFEFIDDQLVIITELADESLEDVYKTHRQSGSCGIPRELLVSHLHDTADGLDHLHQAYQLQHLDIKPGNLLMIGGHVKVADFGLLKDLREADCSVVGGLTPIYAPPEVFDGRPSLHSDQYSLAVMYQELLTGTRPFNGRTIAQLATQHVHSAPNLEPLPPSDRPIVARALEKTPLRRFASCKAFVEALRNARSRGATAGGFDEPACQDSVGTLDGVSCASIKVADLPQLKSNVTSGSADAAASAVCRQHALVVALGGSGAECVRELRRRVASMHTESPLDLHSVLIDTDMETVHSMRWGEVSDRVPKCSVIYTPLRSAAEYRSNGTQRLGTISRRWLYNVPRSCATEGMRPLGRLALVDHGPMVKQRLAEAIERLVDAAGSQPPMIYVVGSLAGGTGSGMYIDVVHLLRHLLDAVGLQDTRILSLLSSTTFHADPTNPLAMHDTQAAIHEIHHFLQVGNGYPGDEGAGWPSVPAARTPLRDVYLVSGVHPERFAPSANASIIEYLWADATGCRQLLDAARQIAGGERQSVQVPALRSVGVVPMGGAHRLEQRNLTPPLVRELMTRWLGMPSKNKDAAASTADRFVRRLNLSPRQTVETLIDYFNDPKMLERASELSLRDRIAKASAQGDLDWLSARWTNNLYRELSVCLNDLRGDLTTMMEAVRLLEQKVTGWADALRCDASDRATAAAIAPAMKTASGDEADRAILTRGSQEIAAKQFDQFVTATQFLQERLERFATILAVAIVETKSEFGNANAWDKMSADLRSHYEPLLRKLHLVTASDQLVRPLNDLETNVDARSMIRQLSDVAVPLVIETVRQCSQQVALEKRKLGLSHDDDDDDDHSTSPAMLKFSNTSMNPTDVTQAFSLTGRPQFGVDPISIEDALIGVAPALLSLGGRQRLILVVGHEVERSQWEPELRALHAGPLTVAVIPGTDPKLIHEAQQIELQHILARLSILNGGNAKVTSRLASRVDVAW